MKLDRLALRRIPFVAALLTAACQGASEGGRAVDPETRPPQFVLVEDLRIGRSEKAGEILTRVSGVKVAGDGSIYAMQPTENLIRIFDDSGRFVRTIGRRGQGPGEFTGFGFFGFHHDTLWVTDPSNKRVTFFRSDGTLARTLPLLVTPPSDSFVPAPPRAVLTDGSILVQFQPTPEDGGMEMSESPTRTVSRSLLARVTPVGAMIDSLRSLEVASYGYGRVGSTFFQRSPLGGGDGPLFAVGPDGNEVVVIDRLRPARADSAFYTINRFVAGDANANADARPPWRVKRISIRYRPTVQGEAVRDSAIASRAASLLAMPDPPPLTADEIRSQLERVIMEADFGPPVTAVVVGRDGTIWLRLAGQPRWRVVDATGAVVGEVSGPPELQLLQAQRSTAWGVLLDDMGLPFVVRYRVEPVTGAGPPGSHQ